MSPSTSTPPSFTVLSLCLVTGACGRESASRQPTLAWPSGATGRALAVSSRVCLPGPKGPQNRAHETPYSANRNTVSEPKFFRSHLTILTQARDPHCMIPCVSAAPCDPLEWSDLKLRHNTQVVMEGSAHWSNAKPMRPSHPRRGGLAPLRTVSPGLASLPITAGCLLLPGLL